MSNGAILIAVGVVLLIGVVVSNVLNNPVEHTDHGVSVECIDGVKYINKRAYNKLALSVKFNKDGSVATCD